MITGKGRTPVLQQAVEPFPRNMWRRKILRDIGEPTSGECSTEYLRRAESAAVAMIAAMITPALLILGSASLVASALMRMARVVDRARLLAAVAHEGSWSKLGVTPDVLRGWLASHANRARYAERSIALLYSAIVVFIATCLSIGADRAAGGSLGWWPIWLAVFGTLLMLGGGAHMVAESRGSGKQINQEISNAISQLEKIES